MDVGLIVTIVANVLFGLMIIVGFLVGFWRGTKRSGIQLAMSIPMAITAIFSSAPITSAILKIKLSNTHTINEKIMEILLEKFPALNDYMAASESGANFVKALPAFIIGIVSFIVLIVLFRFIGYIIAKIIDRCCLPSKKKEKELGLKRNRWAGGAIGLVKAFAFAILTFAPITALAGLVKDLEGQNASSAYSVSATSTGQSALPSTQYLLETYLPKEAKDGVSAYNSASAFGLIGGLGGFDNLIFDTITKVKIEGKSVAVRSEVLDYAVVYNTISDITRAMDDPTNESLKDNLDWEKLDKIVYKIIDGDLFQGVVVNILGDVTKNIDTIDILADLPTEFKSILSKIGADLTGKSVSEYFTSDFKTIYKTISDLGKSGILDKAVLEPSLLTDKVQNILTSTHKADLTSAITGVFNINMLKAAHESIFDFAVTKAEPAFGGVGSLGAPDTKIDDWTKFKTDLITIIDESIDLLDTVNIIDIINDPVSILNITTTQVDSLVSGAGAVLDTINNLELFQCTAVGETDDNVLNKLLTNYGYGDAIRVNGSVSAELYGANGISTYSELLSFISSSIKTALSFDLYDTIKTTGATTTDYILQVAKILSEDSISPAYSTKIKEVLLPLYRVALVKEKIIDDVLLTSVGTEFIDLTALDITSGDPAVYNYTSSYANWESDLTQLTKVLVELYKNKTGVAPNEKTFLESALEGQFESLISEIDSDLVDSLVRPLLYAKSLSTIKTTLFDKVAQGLNAYTGQTTTFSITDTTFVEGSASDQASSTCDVLKALITFTGGDLTGTITLTDLTKAKALMTALQTNANSNGLFKQFYLDIYAKFISSYDGLADILADYTALTVNYNNLFDLIDALTDETNIFGSAIYDAVGGYSDDKMLEVLGTLAGKVTVLRTGGISAINVGTSVSTTLAINSTGIRYNQPANTILVVRDGKVFEVSTADSDKYTIVSGQLGVTSATGLSIKELLTGVITTAPQGATGTIFDTSNRLLITSGANVYAISTTTYTENTDYKIETASETSVNTILDIIETFNYTIEITDPDKKDVAENKIDDLPVSDTTKANLKNLLGITGA